MEEITAKTENTVLIKAYFQLMILAFAWAVCNIIIKLYIDEVPPFHLLTGRFIIAAVCISLTNPKKILSITKKDMKIGSIMGIFLFVTYACAIVCFKYTSASKAGFLIALSVLLIPIVETVLKKKLPSKWTLISIIASVIGLRLISGINGSGFNLGDMIAIACAVAYTGYVLLLDRFGNDRDDFILTIIQLGTVAIIGCIATISYEGINFEALKSGFVPILVMGVFGTGITTFLQTKAQKVASSESVGIILLGEPLFTLIMAYFILNETIFFSGVIGAGLLLFSLVIAIIKKV